MQMKRHSVSSQEARGLADANHAIDDATRYEIERQIGLQGMICSNKEHVMTYLDHDDHSTESLIKHSSRDALLPALAIWLEQDLVH